MQGAFCLACSNRSRTREAPTPTNISTKSEPEIVKNGTPASPATARASSVLPVPGGPYSSTPFGILAPSAWYRLGFCRKSLISYSSSTASFAPATSLNVVLGMSLVSCLARDLPKPIIPPRPPPCIRLMTRKNTTSRMAIGTTNSRIDVSQLSWVTCVLYFGTPESPTRSKICSDADAGYFAMISVLPSVASSPLFSHRPELLLTVVDARLADVLRLELGDRDRRVHLREAARVVAEVAEGVDDQQDAGDNRQITEHCLAVHTGSARPAGPFDSDVIGVVSRALHPVRSRFREQ